MERFGSSELCDTIKRLENHSSVLGLVVMDQAGEVVRTTLNDSQTTYYAQRCRSLIELARSAVRNVDPIDDVKFLRVRSREYELLMATTKEYTLLVKQNTTLPQPCGKLWEI